MCVCVCIGVCNLIHICVCVCLLIPKNKDLVKEMFSQLQKEEAEETPPPQKLSFYT